MASPEQFEWMKDAACAEVGPDMFDVYEKDREVAKEVDRICLNCPAISECFVAGANGNWGQWGGIFWNGYGQPDAKANSHKSEDYLKEVEQLVYSKLQ